MVFSEHCQRIYFFKISTNHNMISSAFKVLCKLILATLFENRLCGMGPHDQETFNICVDLTAEEN